MKTITNLKFGVGLFTILTITNGYSFIVLSKINNFEKIKYNIRPK